MATWIYLIYAVTTLWRHADSQHNDPL